MKIFAASARESAALAIKTLELDEESTDLVSPEGLSASLRRAASFLCPATPRELIDAVLDAIRPLYDDAAPSRDTLMDQLELLISGGDLLELRQAESRTTRLLFLGPPSYVEKEPGRYLVFGVRPFGASLVGASLSGEVLYEGQTRTIQLDSSAAAAKFAALGLSEISRERWVAQPARTEASDLVQRLAQRVAIAGRAGEVEGLKILDPVASVHFYRGRWRSLNSADNGDFVARRPQAYGADLWCLVRVNDGLPQRLIDFPVDKSTVPGRDEAWRLQAAIDSLRQEPQIFRFRPVHNDVSQVIADFFGPVPGWVERYLELVGLGVQRAEGSLFSYRVPIEAKLGLQKVLTDMLWMRVAHEGGTE
jgi:hypothetical protein